MRRALPGLLLLALLACAASPAVLRVGTPGDYAPFSLDGRGFDVDVARALARDLGFRIEWVPFRWPALAADAEAGRFDVAMGGITWLPERAVQGYLTRAVAAGGPCLLGALAPARLGVNRGGALERWARREFPQAEISAVENNRELPSMLAARSIDAIVTDRFELPHFRRPGWAERCEPPRERKVYWVTRAAPAGLAPRIDAWIAEHEPELRRLREQHLGSPDPRDEADHVVDLLARRFALMPHVAAWKRARGAPFEDPAREALVLERAEREAGALGLDRSAARALFRELIEGARAVQLRAAPAPGAGLELERDLRPELDRLTVRILGALARAAPIAAAELDSGRLAPLEPWLEPAELDRLRDALLAQATAGATEGRVGR